MTHDAGRISPSHPRRIWIERANVRKDKAPTFEGSERHYGLTSAFPLQGQAFDKSRGINFQRIGDANHVQQAWVAIATLDATLIARMYSRQMRKGFLAKTSFLSRRSHAAPEVSE